MMGVHVYYTVVTCMQVQTIQEEEIWTYVEQ
jgi:hypothetical protein